MADDPAVAYSVREIVADLRAEIVALRTLMESRLDRIEQQLARLGDTKADQHAVDALAARVGALEIAERERAERERVESEHRRSATEWHRWAWPVCVSLAGVIVGVLAIVLK